MIVHLPAALDDYTDGQRRQEVSAVTLGAGLRALNRRMPGIAFRILDERDCIREHIRVWVDGQEQTDLSVKVSPEAEVHVMLALSGG